MLSWWPGGLLVLGSILVSLTRITRLTWCLPRLLYGYLIPRVPGDTLVVNLSVAALIESCSGQHVRDARVTAG